MDIDLIKKITDDVIQYRYSKKLAFCGRGEPTIHKQIEECLSILNRPDRTYKSYMVTNGTTLKKNWQFIKQLDGLEINTYSTKDKYEERIKRYRVLDNGKAVAHSYKPSDKGRGEDLSTESYTFSPTNRGGFFNQASLQKVCTLPKYWIFIDANGNYSLCCDDWKYKHKIDSVYDKNLFDIYLNNEKLQSIKRELRRGNRTCTKACSECNRLMY
jgi:sulfatase maturation enzyme AslB (radical SAM superfamily)